ncbi:MAG: glycosyltransferase [Acidobacteriaceae bacterium]|nr:glycosyltransferase [Acidobacteriaceae bacterium]MBV9781103.1 glycosyltransferase [Acidobacteriaceae bacterium]
MAEQAVSTLVANGLGPRPIDERTFQLSFDLYERYSALKQIVEFLFPRYQGLKVLDVGGNSPNLWPSFSSLVKTFLADVQCTIVDVDMTIGLEGGVLASGLALPFADNTFDVVCALDTLEHIADPFRRPFIEELVRVSQDVIYLTFPYNSPGSVWAEKTVRTYVEDVLDSPLLQLQEHHELGLPELPYIERCLPDGNLAISKRGHGNVDIWTVMMLASHTLRMHSVEMLRDLSVRFNRELAAYDWGDPTYRISYLISKSRALSDTEEAFWSARPRDRGNLQLSEALRLIREFAESGVAPGIILDKDRHIENLETQHCALEKAVEEKERHIQNLELQREQFEITQRRLQRAIDDKDRHIVNLEAELAAVKRQAFITAELQLRLQRIEEGFGRIAEQQSAAEADIEGLTERLSTKTQHLQDLLGRDIEELTRKGQQLMNTVASQEARLSAQELVTKQLLSSRTWRTLQAVGTVAKLVVPSKSVESGLKTPEETLESRAEVTAGREETPQNYQEQVPIGPKVPSEEANPTELKLIDSKELYFVCDEPSPTDKRPRNRNLIVRGWALGEEHLDYVDLEISGLALQKAYITAPRPDIKHNFPDLDKTGRAGFSASVDTQPLPNGRHKLKLRLIADGQVLREIETEFLIDHTVGYASDYEEWIAEFEKPADEIISLRLPRLNDRPLISIVMPVFNTQPNELQAAIDSVIAQSYSNWELCIVDDGSTRGETKAVLAEFGTSRTNFKVAYSEERGGISAALNTGLGLASGEYVAFLDHDDTLSPHALAYIVEAINRYPAADLIYSDEDKLDERGERYQPFFKPDWSPDLILSLNYVCHLLVIRRELLHNIGEFCSETDGSQDYDLILRASEHARQIVHVPHVLYHWRAGPNSTALSVQTKPYTIEASRRVLERYCERNRNAKVEPAAVPGCWRLRYPIPQGSRVSIIIAAGGKTDVLRPNLEGLFTRTDYKNFEVVVIDNSREGDVFDLVSRFVENGNSIHYIDWRNKPFNYSRINNEAARQCGTPLLLFLNDDVSVIKSDWLTSLVELVARPEVGAVGGKLLFPDGSIQHAGVVMGLFENCGHAFHGQDGELPHYFAFSDVIRNVSAVTGACLMTKADVFWGVGGFDEDRLAVAFNDVDLCLKIGANGYRVLFTPFALLYHHESFSKTQKDFIPHPTEVAVMQSKWRDVIASDPYYSPNLTRRKADYSLPTLWM